MVFKYKKQIFYLIFLILMIIKRVGINKMEIEIIIMDMEILITINLLIEAIEIFKRINFSKIKCMYSIEKVKTSNKVNRIIIMEIKTFKIIIVIKTIKIIAKINFKIIKITPMEINTKITNSKVKGIKINTITTKINIMVISHKDIITIIVLTQNQIIIIFKIIVKMKLKLIMYFLWLICLMLLLNNNFNKYLMIKVFILLKLNL